MNSDLKYFKAAGLVWTVLLMFSSICDVKAHPSKEIYPHPLASSSSPPPQSSHNISALALHANSKNFSRFELIEPSPSSLHKIIHQHEFHAQPSKTGASNLRKIIQRLGYYVTRKQYKKANNSINNNNNLIKNTTSNGNYSPSSISMIDNANRLKRQLEGIFHVRGNNTSLTSTVIPILPSKSTKYPQQIIRHDRNPSSNNNTSISGGGIITNSNSNKVKTAKKETRTEVNTPSKSLISTTSGTIPKSQDFSRDAVNIPRAIKDKRNFTVEIVEISRKTVIKQDGEEPPPPLAPEIKKKLIDSKASLQKENFLKPTHPFYKAIRPRVTLRRFRQPQSQVKILDDSQILESNTKDSNENDKPEGVKSVRDGKTRPTPSNSETISATPIEKPIEVKVNYQEQIPYNDRDIDESDLKDYLEGHSTFGAKGDFKHTISRNVTGFLPNNSPRRGHEVHKRTPQPPTAGSHHSPARSRTRGIKIEEADVRKRAQNPRMTVYTASGENYSPQQQDDDGDSVFQYTGNRDKATAKKETPTPPKIPSFDDLYRQGHPAILKAPKPIYKSHPIGEPYGTRPEEDYQENPFRHNPLTDDPPLKFDPESDRFYGEPTPDKDKKLAQSNSPDPVRVENQVPEYQEEDRRTTSTPRNHYNSNDNNDERYYYQPEYQSNNDDDYNNYGSTEGEPGNDPYIQDFVSLDRNFERLPRPSAEEESFRSLVPAEAEDDTDNRRFKEPERNRGNYNGRGGGGSTTSRSPNSNHQNTRRPPQPPSRESDEDYGDGFDYNPSGAEGPDPDDFDPSYVEALKGFDDEIKKIEENERNGITTSDPVSTTRDPPLVITSPGPAVAYPTDGSAQRPPPTTTPTDQNEDNGDDEEGEDEQTQRPDDRSQEEQGGTEKSEEEDEDETDEPSEERDESTTSKGDNQNEDDAKEGKDAEESRYKRQEVSIEKTKQAEGSTSEKPKEDKSIDLDQDITAIEKEFSHSG